MSLNINFLIIFYLLQRALAISIGSLSTPIGSVVGLVLGPLFIVPEDKTNFQNAKKHLSSLMWCQALLVTVCSAPMIFLYKQRPEHYPSKSAEDLDKQGEEAYSLKTELRSLI